MSGVGKMVMESEKQARVRGVIDERCEMLDKHIAVLTERVECLVDRLGPVLCPGEGDIPAVDDEKPDEHSYMAGMLNEFQKRLVVIDRGLCDILQRLEL